MALPIYISDPSGHARQQETKDFIQANMIQPLLDSLTRVGLEGQVYPALEQLGSPASLEGFGGLILLGGFDIDAALYGGPALGTVSLIDLFELALIREAEDNGIPVLGICRGMQLMNVSFGGTLVSDIGAGGKRHNNFLARSYGLTAVSHPLIVNSSRILPNGEDYTVSSSHHQAIDVLGDELLITGLSPDGIVEMVEHQSLNMVGVQWHPEASHVRQTDTLTPLISALAETVLDNADRYCYGEHYQMLKSAYSAPAMSADSTMDEMPEFDEWEGFDEDEFEDFEDFSSTAALEDAWRAREVEEFGYSLDWELWKMGQKVGEHLAASSEPAAHQEAE